MDAVFGLLLLVLGFLFAFYFGITLGISDCKRTFNIPKNAVGVDENGYIYS